MNDFDLVQIAKLAKKLLRLFQKRDRIRDDSFPVADERFGLIFKTADDLDVLLNPSGLRPEAYNDILEASVDDEAKVALLALRERFDRRFHISLFDADSRVMANNYFGSVKDGQWLNEFGEAITDLEDAIQRQSREEDNLPREPYEFLKPNTFRWKDLEIQLQPLHYRLLEFLFNSEGRKASFEDCGQPVWGIDDVSTNRIKGAVSRLGSALAEAGIPIALSTKSAYIILTVPESE